MIRISETLAWLVLAVVAALFLQLPVRDLLVGKGLIRGSPQVVINDYGQLFHATVFLVGIPYAISTDRHVRLDAFRGRFSVRTRARIEVLGYSAFALTWAGVLAYFGADPVWRSITLGESFPETGTSGYTLTRVAYVLFVLLLVVASTARVLRSLPEALGRGGPT